MMTDWPVKKLGEVADYFNDGNWIESKDQSKSGIRLVQTGNIGLGYFKDKDDKARFISEDTFGKLKCTEIFEGDILISRLPDPVGRSCILPRLDTRAVTAVDCSIVRFSNDLLARYFNYYSLTDNYFREISKYLTGSSRVRISRANLAKVNIILPQQNIQKKIVERLDAIRKSQELNDLQISKIEELFESILERELSPKKGWAKVKITEIASITSGGTPLRTKNEYYNGDIPWIKSGEVRQGLITSSEENISEAGLKNSSAKIFPKGTVLIAMYGATTGQVGILGIEAATNQAIAGIVANERKVLSKFLYFFYRAQTDKFIELSGGGAQPNISQTIIKNYSVDLPTLDQQKKIVEKLSAVQEHKKLLLKQKSLLRELFDSVLDKCMKGELVN